MFDKVLPVDFLEQSILSDTKFVKVDRNGFHYQAVLVSGIAGVSPIEVIKRSAPVQICTLAFLFFIS